MKRFVDIAVSSLLLFVGFISSVLSTKNRAKLGMIIGNILRLLSPNRQKVTLDNIQKAFPDLTTDKSIDIMKKSYQNLGITLVELLVFPKLKRDDFEKYIKYENIELISDVYNRGKGLILLSGHFGNWELLAFTAGLFSKIPVTVIVKPQSNHISDEYLNKYRTLGGNKIVPMGNAARTIIKCIQNHEAIALLADQSADWQKDIFVDFFGRLAATYEAPANISLKFDVPMIMGFAVRQSDFTYRVKLIEIDRTDLDKSQDSIKILTERHVKILEDAIKENPHLWAWQHKRWKHDPPVKQVSE